MLTLLLLVVLGGGAGLLAVSMIESGNGGGVPRRPGGASLRGTRGAHTPAADRDPATADDPPDPAREEHRGHDEPGGHHGGDGHELQVVQVADLVEAADAGTGYAPLTPPPDATWVAGEPGRTPPSGAVALAPPPDRGGRRVPAAHTAIEGSYRDVARSPLWRRLTSLLLLLVILAVLSVAVTALAAAAIGLVAELVDRAIG